MLDCEMELSDDGVHACLTHGFAHGLGGGEDQERFEMRDDDLGGGVAPFVGREELQGFGERERFLFGFSLCLGQGVRGMGQEAGAHFSGEVFGTGDGQEDVWEEVDAVGVEEDGVRGEVESDVSDGWWTG